MLYYSYSYYVECIYLIANIATWTYKANNTMSKKQQQFKTTTTTKKKPNNN